MPRHHQHSCHRRSSRISERRWNRARRPTWIPTAAENAATLPVSEFSGGTKNPAQRRFSPGHARDDGERRALARTDGHVELERALLADDLRRFVEEACAVVAHEDAQRLAGEEALTDVE